jgi:heat shock protein HtpX
MTQLPPNIYEQQSANRRNTIIVMGMFTVFVGFLGFGIDAFILGTETQFPIATFIALCIGGTTASWGLNSGASTILASASATPVPPDEPKYQQLRNVVDEMTIASGIPRPQLFVITDPDPNAFATGRDPEHACIAVTEGLLEKLSREELQAVIAHEMSHVRNFDIRMMTVVAALGGAVMLLSEFGLRSMRFSGGRKRGRGGNLGPIILVLWLVAMILAPFIMQLLSMAVSRQREYLADASGAELTRNPLALASALEKIDSATEPTKSIKKGTGHLCIADPLGRSINSKEGSLADLFATHPPIAKRVMLLRGMAHQHT